MKRTLLAICATIACSVGFAQSIIVVDSEKIFRSLDEYNNAITTIEALTTTHQTAVDTQFAEVERLFNEYAANKARYSVSTQQATESMILERERAATEYQELYFAQDGFIMKQRVALITPIQERVFGVIDSYAKEQGADIVVDKASNPSLLYTNPTADRTQEIIDRLK